MLLLDEVEASHLKFDGSNWMLFAALEHLRHHEDRDEGRDRGAVLGRLAEHVVRGPDVAGARHVLRHDRRLAGNVVGEMARDDARIGVEPAADAGRDDEFDVLAPVEVGLGGGRSPLDDCRRSTPNASAMAMARDRSRRMGQAPRREECRLQLATGRPSVKHPRCQKSSGVPCLWGATKSPVGGREPACPDFGTII